MNIRAALVLLPDRSTNIVRNVQSVRTYVTELSQPNTPMDTIAIDQNVCPLLLVTSVVGLTVRCGGNSSLLRWRHSQRELKRQSGF